MRCTWKLWNPCDRRSPPKITAPPKYAGGAVHAQCSLPHDTSTGFAGKVRHFRGFNRPGTAVQRGHSKILNAGQDCPNAAIETSPWYFYRGLFLSQTPHAVTFRPPSSLLRPTPALFRFQLPAILFPFHLPTKRPRPARERRLTKREPEAFRYSKSIYPN